MKEVVFCHIASSLSLLLFFSPPHRSCSCCLTTDTLLHGRIYFYFYFLFFTSFYCLNVQFREEAERHQALAQKEFERVTQNLHHLVSTSNISGVYNSPYAMEPTTVGGIPVEEHIRARQVAAADARLHEEGPVVDANGSRKIPVRPPKSRLSIQASSSTTPERTSASRLLGRMSFSGRRTPRGRAVQGAAHGGGSTRAASAGPLAQPVLCGASPSRYESTRAARPWAPVPFHVSVGGNKSAVLPNGIFDVIAEAEDSGGVCQRHRSTIVRFGVP